MTDVVKAAAAIVRAMGMQAENDGRLANGQALAYDSTHFEDLARELEAEEPKAASESGA